jgi:hypothetical protein
MTDCSRWTVLYTQRICFSILENKEVSSTMLCLIVFGFAYTLDKDGAIYAVVFLLSAQENQKLIN